MVGYGNRDPGGSIDSFWPDGALRISSLEQVAFAERLYSSDLPFSEEHMDIVRECLLLEKSDSGSLYGKIGGPNA